MGPFLPVLALGSEGSKGSKGMIPSPSIFSGVFICFLLKSATISHWEIKSGIFQPATFAGRTPRSWGGIDKHLHSCDFTLIAEARKVVVAVKLEIKLKMNAKTVFKGRNATNQIILFGNIYGLAHFVIGKSKAWAFDIPTLAIKRNDTMDVQQRIYFQ